MKNLFGSTFYIWLAITFFYLISFRFLDYIFGVSSNFSFFDVGLLAFIILWCGKQDEINREGE